LQYDAEGDQELAIADYNEAIALDPAFLQSAGNNRAVAYFHKKDYNGAVANFSELIVRYPTNRPARVFRGAIYALMGNYDGAIADFDEYSKQNPDAAIGLYGRGLVQLRKADAAKQSNGNTFKPAQQNTAGLSGDASISAAKLLNVNVAELWAREIGLQLLSNTTGPEILSAKSAERPSQN
jgi:tetratricopeptide (TPR) repeat protein